MNINERVKFLRKTLNMNQEEFGKRVAIAQGYLTNIENNKRKVTEKILKLICLEFNVSEQWLRFGEGEVFVNLNRDEEIIIWASKITQDGYKNEFVKRFAGALSKLEEDDWKVVEKIINLISPSASEESATLSQSEFDREEAHKLLDEELNAVEKGQKLSALNTINSQKNPA